MRYFEPKRHKIICASIIAAIACLAQPHVAIGQDPSSTDNSISPALKTIAEKSGYQATSDGYQVEYFLRELASTWKEAELKTLGQTIEGRPIWALVVQPTVVTDQRPVTALVLGGIHSGECDGKEAILALARDMANGNQEDWWKSLQLVFVPNFNADANQRRSPHHRPGQAGPDDGMGLRENAQGLDLNRDFVKLESPEVRALVAAIDTYNVDVLIDTHTTNGSLHRYELTYDIPHTPTLPKATDQWLRTELIPTVTDRLSKDGFSTFYYGNFDAEHRKWTTFGHQPRYSTEYMGLRGRIGILAESYSYASYKTRVEVSYAFVRETLRSVAEQADVVRQLSTDADARTQGSTQLPLQAEIGKAADGVVLHGFQRDDGSPPVGPYDAESSKQHTDKDYQVQLWNRAVSTKSTRLPSGYLIPVQYSWAVSRLRQHGVVVSQLTTDIEIQVETYGIQKVDRGRTFQGHAPVSVEVFATEATQQASEDMFYVDTAQPLGVLAGFLLEPESDESLLQWNFFAPDIAVGETYPVLRVLAPVSPSDLRSADTIPAGERIDNQRLFQAGKTVNYTGERLDTAVWLPGSSQYVVPLGSGSAAVDALTGAIRPMNEHRGLARKLEKLDAFTAEEAETVAKANTFDDDWSHALVAHKNDLYYYNATSNIARQLTHSTTESEQMPELNPQGSRAAFIRDNNLWVVDCESTELRQITTDGSAQRLNGILDWVYQEELYGRGNFKSFWWSPDGEQIAFLQLDQTPVDTYQVSDSISYKQSTESTRYPKAGDALPSVRVLVANAGNGSLLEVDLSAFSEDDRLVGRVTWAPEGELWLQVFNRVQNRQDLVRVDPASGGASTLFSESSPGWIEIRGVPHFLPDGSFLWLSDLPEGRTHLFKVDAETGKRAQLTSGQWDVQELLSVSDDETTAFVSSNISHPTERQLLGVDIDSATFRQITSSPGVHRTTVDSSGKFFIDTFSNATSPPRISLHSINGQLQHVIDAPTSDRHKYVNIRPAIRTSITTRDGLQLQASVMLPPGVSVTDSRNSNAEGSPQDVKKIPVLFYVYGGPQNPTVKNEWAGRNYWWHQMLCQQGIAVVLCDNRSALGRGVKDTWTIRGDMGRVELQDLEDTVAWVSKQPWADPDRFGMWGWSYGGYFTAYAMTHSKLFKAGIAGAPVTDWRNYDAIYTERYMDLPQNNSAGYDSSSVVKAAANLHGRLLVIHGERDDNVHMSNTLQLVHELQKAGKQFDLMIYPKNRHSIAVASQRYHLHQLMTDFLLKHLQPTQRD